VILSLLNISTETQAQSRLAVLRQAFGRQVTPVARRTCRAHWAYGPSACSIPPFAALDTSVNAKQEGSP
jgi:hypothetical protein